MLRFSMCLVIGVARHVSMLKQVLLSVLGFISHHQSDCRHSTIPVTSSECEQSFSALQHLKRYIHSTIGQTRLIGLALIHIHYEMNINLNKVINMFATKRLRWMAMSSNLDGLI